MKIGISTSTFFNNTAPENMFELMRNMRVDTAELCLNTFSEYEKPYVDRLAAFRGNINVVAVSPLGIQFESQLFSPNVRVRADAELLFKKVCYACFAFGAKFYTFRGPIDLDGDKNLDITRMAQRINQLADIAAGYGVSLSLKNMRWSYAAQPAFFKRITDMCPKLFATFDMFNAENAGYDLREFFDSFPPQRISLIEVADIMKGEWMLPGKGKYNYDRLFADLDRRKIFAPIMISVSSDSYADFVQVRDSFEYLNGIYLKSYK